METTAGRTGGFSIVETVLALALFIVLLAGVFSVTFESLSFASDTDAAQAAQAEAQRSFARLRQVLRKSGRVTILGTEYPVVKKTTRELRFKLPSDLDGNGYPFDETTGEVEWDPRTFVIRVNQNDELEVAELGGPSLWLLGRHAANLDFETIDENPARHLREIYVTYEIRWPLRDGTEYVYTVSGSIFMRN